MIKSWFFWIVLAGLGCGGIGAFAVTRPKLYRATSIIKMVPVKVVDSNSLGEVWINTPYTLNRVLAVLRSRRFAADVIRSYTREELFQIVMAKGASVTASLGKIRITPAQSLTIDIEVSHQDPAAAVLIANHYASELPRFLDAEEQEERKQATFDLKERCVQLESEVKAVRSAYEEAKQSGDPLKIEQIEKQLTIAQGLFANVSQRLEETAREPADTFFSIGSLAQKAEPLPWWKSL